MKIISRTLQNTCLSCFFLGRIAVSFSIDSPENPTVFTPVTVSWSRNGSDPSSFWFDTFRADIPSPPLPGKKLMSFQVYGLSDTKGSLTMVFIQEGVHVIAAADSEKNGDNAFFISPPITAVGSQPTGTPTSTLTNNPTAGSPTCSPVAASPSPSASITITAQPNSNLGAAVAGGTVGGFIFGTVVATTIIFLLLRRRRRQNHSPDVDEPPQQREMSHNGGNRLLRSIKPPNARVINPFPFGVTPNKLSSPAFITGQEKRRFAQNLAQEVFIANTPSRFQSSPAVDTRNEQPPSPVTHASTTFHGSQTFGDSLHSTSSEPLTQRQRLLVDEAGRLRLQILGMVNDVLSTSRNEPSGNQAEVEQLRTQIRELEAQRDSEWARGLTDEPPSYFSLTRPHIT